MSPDEIARKPVGLQPASGPFVIITRSNAARLSHDAFDRLGKPASVRIYLDYEARKVIFEAGMDDPGEVRVLPPKGKDHLREVGIRRTLQLLNVVHQEARRYPLEEDGGRLVADLSKNGEPVDSDARRGGRSRSQKNAG